MRRVLDTYEQASRDQMIVLLTELVVLTQREVREQCAAKLDAEAEVLFSTGQQDKSGAAIRMKFLATELREAKG
jgi:hypothetical protein